MTREVKGGREFLERVFRRARNTQEDQQGKDWKIHEEFCHMIS